MCHLVNNQNQTLADSGFPPEMGQASGGVNAWSRQIFPKTAWNWKKLDTQVGTASLSSLRSANAKCKKKQSNCSEMSLSGNNNTILWPLGVRSWWIHCNTAGTMLSYTSVAESQSSLHGKLNPEIFRYFALFAAHPRYTKEAVITAKWSE